MRRAAAVVLFLFAAGAQAHPGHAVADLWHLLTEPDHLAIFLLPLVLAGGIWLIRRKRRASHRQRSDNRSARRPTAQVAL